MHVDDDGMENSSQPLSPARDSHATSLVTVLIWQKACCTALKTRTHSPLLLEAFLGVEDAGNGVLVMLLAVLEGGLLAPRDLLLGDFGGRGWTETALFRSRTSSSKIASVASVRSEYLSSAAASGVSGFGNASSSEEARLLPPRPLAGEVSRSDILAAWVRFGVAESQLCVKTNTESIKLQRRR